MTTTPRLLVRRDDGSVRAVIIRGVAKIGSASGNEVTIQHPSVMPLHASVGLNDGALWVEDAGGATGTKVNGERVSRRSALRHLDVVTIGDDVHLVVLNNDIAGSDTRVVPQALQAPPLDLDGATIETRPGRAGDQPIRGVQLIGTTAAFESAAGICIVGRGRDATFRIDSKDVSRKHATIEITSTGVTIEDPDSANGTSVNGQPIKGRGVITLADGDKVAFATFTFTVRFVR